MKSSDDLELDRLRDECQRQHPQFTWIVDAGAVWLRDYEQGKDLAYFSKLLGGGIASCITEDGHTVRHRPLVKVPRFRMEDK